MARQEKCATRTDWGGGGGSSGGGVVPTVVFMDNIFLGADLYYIPIKTFFVEPSHTMRGSDPEKIGKCSGDGDSASDQVGSDIGFTMTIPKPIS